MPDNLIEQYLAGMGIIRGTRANVPETSFYPALEKLLSGIGKSLSPKVHCIVNPANQGAGIPDGGLFTADQIRNLRNIPTNTNPFLVQTPARGVIEAKPLCEDVIGTAAGEQVERYRNKYGLVLVTNFRAFALVGSDTSGKPKVLETFALAETEDEFWRLAAHPRKTAAERGERLLEYLKRALMHNAPLVAPRDVASILASYAHDARLRIEKADIPALKSLRQALEEALGLRFEGEKGEHFFRSTLVQTLFYGIFSAWVLWSRQQGSASGRFDWHTAFWQLRVPILRDLFVQVADRNRLGALGLVEVLDWSAAALNRVDRAEFFKSFDEGHAVQYFYEPFLHAYDPKLRKQLGVWYTPEEIVRYQVERVDAVLRSELGLADGLADPKVVVLDPCCGTGAYLREVLRRIAATLKDKGGDALVAQDLKKAALERVFGFEILPAPFVVAHLQLGLELENLGAPLGDGGDPAERAGVFLTNALTGWEPPREKQKEIPFAGFQEEREAAGRVKQEKPILVILGNPPYNAFAGVSPDEEQGLVEPYKDGLISEWGIKKFNLDDLYIRFFRLAEKRIAEHGGRGVVSFISNHSWVSEPSFVVLRKHLLESFDRFWIENMHGNRKISEYAPDGRTSETIFAIPGFSVGIQQGVAISLWVKHTDRSVEPLVRFRDDINDAKAVERRVRLLDSLREKDFDKQYEVSKPCKDFKWNFRPLKISQCYRSWPQVSDLCETTPTLGILDNRQEGLISEDREKLQNRIFKYLDSKTSWEELRITIPELTRDYARFNAKDARAKLIAREIYKSENLRRVFMRPMDNRWCYYTSVRPIWTETRPTYVNQCWQGNVALVTRRKGVADPEGPPFFVSSILGMQHSMHTDAYYIPMQLKHGSTPKTNTNDNIEMKLSGMERITSNLSNPTRYYLASLGLPDPDTDKQTAGLVWNHALAIGYSPAYLEENSDGIRQDWPRIPLPLEREVLLASAVLGRRVAALLDTETPVPGVTTGNIDAELKDVARFERVDGNQARPEAGDLDLTAGWGHAGKGGITMPGKGKLTSRADGAYDVFLNDFCCWRNVPQPVWTYTIGGYQVIKKWLSYREKQLLGRGLTPEEVRYVSEMARRIKCLVDLQPELDENYRKVAANTHPPVSP